MWTHVFCPLCSWVAFLFDSAAKTWGEEGVAWLFGWDSESKCFRCPPPLETLAEAFGFSEELIPLPEKPLPIQENSEAPPAPGFCRQLVAELARAVAALTKWL